jgi:hypothetical protein
VCTSKGAPTNFFVNDKGETRGSKLY